MTIDYGAPESFFVFLVGHCEEWPENRVEQGDIALFHEYLAAGVPRSHICFVKDRDCTNTNCQKQLEHFLQTTKPQSTLVFYYGGHGHPTGFNTIQDEWTYRQVCHTVDETFQGERVLFLLDCCASGNLARWLAPPFQLKKEYIAIANAAPFIEASDDGEEWVLSNSFLRGMRSNHGDLPLERVLDFLTDRIALVLGDQATIYASSGADCQRSDWMPRRTSSDVSDSIEWNRLNENIPDGARVSSRWSIGNCVFYKHPGGSIKSESTYLPPGWYSATIVRETDTDGCFVDLEVQCPTSALVWKVHVPRNELMNDCYMGQMWMVPDQCERALCLLAKNFKYWDFSIAPNTVVTVLADSDGDVRSARVLDWRYFDFKAYLKSGQCSRDPPFGAHVAVEWYDDDAIALLPVQQISFPAVDVPSFSPSLDEVEGIEGTWARKAMLISIESSGKTVVNAKDTMGSMLVAFWPSDERWCHAQPLDPQRVSLKILASHVQFTLKGPYCPLSYEDGDRHLSPAFYVDRRASSFKMKGRSCLTS